MVPHYTDCRPGIQNEVTIGENLAFATDGEDLLAVVPDILKLFPYEFTGSSLPVISWCIQTKPTIYAMTIISMFRSRYADTVELSVLPCVVVSQILIMGVISLYQVISHKRSVLLAQIWAYRCQNGRMQPFYLAQVTCHLAFNSNM